MVGPRADAKFDAALSAAGWEAKYGSPAERSDTHTRTQDRHLIALEKAYRTHAYGMMKADEFSREVMPHLQPVILAAIRSRSLRDRLDSLKEAVRDVLHFADLEAAGMARPGHRKQELQALSALRDALNEDGPDDRRGVA